MSIQGNVYFRIFIRIYKCTQVASRPNHPWMHARTHHAHTHTRTHARDHIIKKFCNREIQIPADFSESEMREVRKCCMKKLVTRFPPKKRYSVVLRNNPIVSQLYILLFNLILYTHTIYSFLNLFLKLIFLKLWLVIAESVFPCFARAFWIALLSELPYLRIKRKRVNFRVYIVTRIAITAEIKIPFYGIGFSFVSFNYVEILNHPFSSKRGHWWRSQLRHVDECSATIWL